MVNVVLLSCFILISKSSYFGFCGFCFFSILPRESIHWSIPPSSPNSPQSSSLSSDFQHPIWAGQWCWHSHGKPNRFCLSLRQLWQPHHRRPCNDLAGDCGRDDPGPVQPSGGPQPPGQRLGPIAALVLGAVRSHGTTRGTAYYRGGATGGSYSQQQRSEEGKDARESWKRGVGRKGRAQVASRGSSCRFFPALPWGK